MRKAAFLDRDGTINQEKHYLCRIEDFHYLDGAVDGLKALQDLDYLLIVITNQSGIARGFYTEENYRALMDWMAEDLSKKGVHVAKDYFCPHLPDGVIGKYTMACGCRKPGTELFYRAQREFDIDFSASVAIGDRLRDLSICRETPTKGILLGERKERMGYSNIHCCRDWKEVIAMVRGWKKENES